MASMPSSSIGSSPRVMENKDCVILSGDSTSGCEADIQDGDDCLELTRESCLKSPAHIEDNRNIIGEPIIGMEFSSDESAFKFYNVYGRKIGFNVRKRNINKSKAGFVTKRVFCCSKEGQRQKDKRRENVLYRQPVSRVGCKAQMTCKLQKNGKYQIVSFDPNHNHELVRTPLKHIQKVDRCINDAQKSHAAEVDRSGVLLTLTIDLMGKENGGCEHLGFTDKGYQNYIPRKRKTKMEKGDAGAILQYFQKMQLENSSYFYSIQLDEDDMITNIFWADARSVSDYGLFGDVVCFDTTYRTNDYGRPFAPIIGVNHHRQTVIFGAAFLYDESIDSFKWLFEAFLGVMSGKQPKTILTDRSAEMAKAISDVFPKAYHRLCVWHIYQSATKFFSHVFNSSKQFVRDFSECIFDFEDEDEWLLAWSNMLEKYSLTENMWLKTLFEEREKWALVYGRHSFYADMKTTQCSESITNVLKKYLKSENDLVHFFDNYERVLADWRYEELLEDFKMMQTSPALSANVQMLRHGAEVYTPEVFKLFQKEYMSFLNCNIHKVCKAGTTSEYKVTCVGKSKEYLVNFDVSTHEVVCSCMKFTFVGVLCAHALKVLDKKNVKNIPPQYIITRWTRDAKARSVSDYRRMEIHDNPTESLGKRFGHLSRNFREIASFAAEHKELTAYVHDGLVMLLKNLQEKKKNIFQDHLSVISSFPGETSSSGNEHAKRKRPLSDPQRPNTRNESVHHIHCPVSTSIPVEHMNHLRWDGRTLSLQPTMRIFNKAEEVYCLSDRNGYVILTPANPQDEYQHWVKDMKFGTRVKDEEGFPSFALVNKATGQAIKHSIGATHPVRLVPYNLDNLDQSVLWTESKDIGEGFRSIRMVNNIRLNFDALQGDEEQGGVHDGTVVVLSEWLNGKNQRWKIMTWEVDPPPVKHANLPQWDGGSLGCQPLTVRIFTKAEENYSLSIRDGTVILTLANPHDEYQQWIKDMKYSTTVKDEQGFPSFALVNKVTCQAIKHSISATQPVRLVPYNPNFLDGSVLWTESKDTDEGFRRIRTVNKICLNFHAFILDEVRDGTIVGLWEQHHGENQRWKIVSY